MNTVCALVAAATLLVTTTSGVMASPVAMPAPTSAVASPVIPGEYIVVLADGTSRRDVIRQAAAAGGETFAEYRHALNGFAARLPTAALSALARNRNVVFVAENRVVGVSRPKTPAPPSPCLSGPCPATGVDRIDADLSSARSGDGSGTVDVNVAVLDSGSGANDPALAPNGHPDLNVVGGFNCTSGQTDAYADGNGHGTHVAGTIAARDNEFGVVGVVPGARIWSVKVLNQNGVGNDSSVICGIDWATGTRLDSDGTNDILVANMSLGGRGGDDGNCGHTNRDAVHIATCNSVAAGVSYVVAAGNEGVDLAAQYPASYDEVLTVTAIADYDAKAGALAQPSCGAGAGPDDGAATFSNYATSAADQAHTIAAPGTCILSTWPWRIYATASGTSMAAPHVAGTVALCIAAGPCAGLSPQQIIGKILGDTFAFNTANPQYGFAGDPLRSVAGKYYGYLVSAASY